MHRNVALFATIAVLASACGMSARVPVDPATLPPEVPVLADTASESVVVRTNAEREKLGLPKLLRSNRLMRAAQIQADQMAAAYLTAHDLPDAKYPSMDDRLAAVGYRYRAAGENVAGGQPNSAFVVATWMKSPGHRANIVSENYVEMGAAVAIGKNGRHFWAQVFGAPR